MDKKKVVMVFGVFDLLHDGHRHFFREARKRGDTLIAVLASDAIVEKLKGTPPENPLLRRKKNLENLGLADDVVSGDESLGDWEVIARYSPDEIALGYDQQELAESLKAFLKRSKSNITLVFIPPYADETLHSSALRKNI